MKLRNTYKKPSLPNNIRAEKEEHFFSFCFKVLYHRGRSNLERASIRKTKALEVGPGRFFSRITAIKSGSRTCSSKNSSEIECQKSPGRVRSYGASCLMEACDNLGLRCLKLSSAINGAEIGGNHYLHEPSERRSADYPHGSGIGQPSLPAMAP